MRTFLTATSSEFDDLINAYPFSRTITDIHLHHTWKPRRADYRGLATIESMWRYHTQTNGWEDIAQHVTVAPDGEIWLCRNFNWVPASARGFNGNSNAGPFMIELIGNFDDGMDAMPLEQVESTLSVIRSVQAHFDLPASALRFHRDMSTKSCPGTNMDKQEWIGRIENDVAPTTRSARPSPERTSRFRELLEDLNPDAPQNQELIEAEQACGHTAHSRSAPRDAGSRELDDAALVRLANHVVNLERGQLSTSGRIQTTHADIDRMFDEMLVEKIRAAHDDGRTFRLLFFAHGGLVSEKNALKGALDQLDFWLDNGIFPIFFIWETGLAETIKQLLRHSASRGEGHRGGLPRGSLKDDVIEALARTLGGDKIWAGMQSSARHASDDQGGARYVAKKTEQLASRFTTGLQIHTVGHSAGSIFQTHFMGVLSENKVTVNSAHFLAPAMRNDLFHAAVAPLLGERIAHLSVFTMNERREKRDSVAGIYGQSLLYLISEALEQKRQTPILGLEESLRHDKTTREVFGLRGAASSTAEVIFSPSVDRAGGTASDASTHGGFDEDPATMESVARRILNRLRGESIVAFPSSRTRDIDVFWDDQFEWPTELSAAAPSPSVSNGSGSASADQRRVTALCIGIDSYTESPLAGCVNDAMLWARTLGSLGFVAEVMPEEQATGDGIRQRLERLIRDSVPGDHLVFQFAGHGTQFEDFSGDESDATGAQLDECLCAFDCERSERGLVIDDEIRVILDTLPEGVEMTCFFDCCHSGSATRMINLKSDARRDADSRARFLMPTDFMTKAYTQRLDEVRQRARQMNPLRREVLFSACRDHEKAFETRGQGDFTRIAIELLRSSAGRLSNVDFLERVVESFGAQARQTPQIDCEFTGRSKLLLGVSSPSSPVPEEKGSSRSRRPRNSEPEDGYS